MNRTICSWCYVDGHKLVEAVAIIPELVFAGSKDKLIEIGICAAHREDIFPNEFFEVDKRHKRRQTDKGDEAYASDATARQAASRRANKALPILTPSRQNITTQDLGKAVGLSPAGVIYHQRVGHVKPIGRTLNPPSFIYDRSAVAILKDLISTKGERSIQAIKARQAKNREVKKRGRPPKENGKGRGHGSNVHSRKPKLSSDMQEVEPGTAGWHTPEEVRAALKITRDQLTHIRKKGKLKADGYWGNQYMFSSQNLRDFANASKGE